MTKWILLTLGFLLLVPEALYFIQDPIRPDDIRVPFRNLVEIPALELRQGQEVSVSMTVPDDAVWKRIRRSWGEPDYEVALISSLNELQYCFEGINVTATEGNGQVSLQPGWGIYGFSDGNSYQCQSAGRRFRAAPGAVVNINLTATGQFGSGEMIVVRPIWYNTKDKLVGVYIDRDLRSIVRSVFAAGLVMILLAGLLVLRERYTRNRPAPQKNLPA